MHSIVRKLPAVARVLLGLIFTVFGLNGFLHFIPQPPMHPGPMMDFFMGLMGTGYFFPLLKGTEVAAGLLLLANRFVPLALTVLAPIVVNIVAVHTFLAPAGLPLAVVVLALEVYLAWAHREAYEGVLRARTPEAAPESARVPATAHPSHA